MKAMLSRAHLFAQLSWQTLVTRESASTLREPAFTQGSAQLLEAKKETKGRGAGGEERSAVYKVAALGEKLQFLQISYRNKRMLILLSPSYFFLDQDSSTKFFPSQYFFHFRFVITVFLESLIGSRKNRKSSLRSIVVKLRTCSVCWRISNHWSTKVSCFLIYRGNEN